MHSRNIYTTAPNFSELAEEVPALKALWVKSNLGMIESLAEVYAVTRIVWE